MYVPFGLVILFFWIYPEEIVQQHYKQKKKSPFGKMMHIVAFSVIEKNGHHLNAQYFIKLEGINLRNYYYADISVIMIVET